MIERSPDVEYCGVTFGADMIKGIDENKQPVEANVPTIRAMAVEADRSAARARLQAAGGIVVLGFAALIVLNMMQVIKFKLVPGGDGIAGALLIALAGSGYKLLSTAWDPVHLLVIDGAEGKLKMLLSPRPEPFELMEKVDRLQKDFGYKIELYPGETR
jgi:hypothetical protein